MSAVLAGSLSARLRAPKGCPGRLLPARESGEVCDGRPSGAELHSPEHAEDHCREPGPNSFLREARALEVPRRSRTDSVLASAVAPWRRLCSRVLA